MDDKLIQQILGIVIPEEILEDFVIERIEEREEERVFHMVEKESRKPEAGEVLMKDGYMRPKDWRVLNQGFFRMQLCYFVKAIFRIPFGHSDNSSFESV